MGEDDIGKPSVNTPNWWLTDEVRLKYRGPKTWERNRQEILKNKENQPKP